MTALAPSMQAYFTDRLINQRRASPNTIAAYRHTFRLLLAFATERTGAPPSRLDITDLDAPLIAAFLDHLQTVRNNTVATRNNRLAAIHSLFAYLALHHPEHADTIARVLAIPAKRTERNLLTYLTDPEVTALLAACNQATWTGRRDHAMLALTIQTGLRISEVIALDCQDITLGTGANVHTIGKGRKTRRTPLIPTIRTVLKAWVHERAGNPDEPLFPTRNGTRLSRDAVEHRLAINLNAATDSSPSLKAKHITMHTLRHYVDGWVMWPAGDFPVLGVAPGTGSGHIILGRGQRSAGLSVRSIRSARCSLRGHRCSFSVWEIVC
jgi:integrase/recombinase XerD